VFLLTPYSQAATRAIAQAAMHTPPPQQQQGADVGGPEAAADRSKLAGLPLTALPLGAPPGPRELTVRLVGGLLLLRAARGKWVPEYASAVLVAVVDDICAGLGGANRRHLAAALMAAIVTSSSST